MGTTDGAALEARLERYLGEGLGAVTGWFETESAEVIAALLLHQARTGVTGDVAEIGVHHGKSFLLLANGILDGERAVALDVFDDQHLNVDQSGKGDRAVFEQNLAAWADPAAVTVLQASSTDVEPADAASTFGNVRLFSVDGGHTAAITAHDLRLAEACIVPDGVVVLDDILNPAWLGVLTGLRDYIAEGGKLRAFATSANKLYLAFPAAAPSYVEHLRVAMADLLGKRDVEFFDAQVDVYGMGSPRRNRARAAARKDAEKAVLATERFDATIGALESRLAELETALADARRGRAEAERRVRALTSSTSWRVTGPVRLASRVARRVQERRKG
ncbi:MAG TPA: class I SAM-dependent methyltransferase [Nocardioides sp.]